MPDYNQKQTIFWYGFAHSVISTISGLGMSAYVGLSNTLHNAWEYISNSLLGYKDSSSGGVWVPGSDTPEDTIESGVGEAVVDQVYIPNNIAYSDRDEYELIEYVNDVTQPNTQVLAEYTNQDTQRTAYSYGLDRLTYEPQGRVADYYLYDGRGSVKNEQWGRSFLFTFQPIQVRRNM